MNELTLQLALDKKTTERGRMPEATLVLSNEGSSVVLVNARMLLVPEGSPEEIGEVVFEVESPAGSYNRIDFSVNAGVALRESFVKLQPGASVVRTYALEKYFSYEDSGSYTIKATYRNVLELSDKELVAWTGSLSSNEQHFEIKA